MVVTQKIAKMQRLAALLLALSAVMGLARVPVPAPAPASGHSSFALAHERAWGKHKNALTGSGFFKENVRVADDQVHAQPMTNLRVASDEVTWAYGYSYQGTTCTTEPGPYTQGAVTNVCLQSQPLNATVDSLTSFFYTCSDDGVTVSEYASVNCDPTTMVNTTVYPATCQSNGDAVDPISMQFYCGNSKTQNLAATYILTQGYADGFCQYLVGFSGPRNQYCIAVEDMANVYDSYWYDYPTMAYFRNVSDCSGTPTEVFTMDNSTETCHLNTEADDDGGDHPIFFYELDTLASSVTAGAQGWDWDDDFSTYKLSDGAIAGIVIGAVVVAGIVAAAVYLLCFRGKADTLLKKEAQQTQTGVEATAL